ncbi:MAG: asparaginase [Paracoccaceae bacterium]
MSMPHPMCEAWRGPVLENVHLGHAVVCDATGDIVQAWGDPNAVMLPRSSCKMIQALPLITSGAAGAFGLRQDQLALACASHNGATIHTHRVRAWLTDLGLGDHNLRCGPQMPRDEEERASLRAQDTTPCQWHNNCSGKHAGFLTLNKHLGGGADYHQPDHLVQQACLTAFEDTTGQDTLGYGIDGCSAPNFATTVHGLARAMAWFASAADRNDVASNAASDLVQAMCVYPELVAGEGRACTELMRAMDGRVAIKTGADAVFVAIIPERKMGVALKIADGTMRAAECAIAHILIGLGVLDAHHPAAQKYRTPDITNWNGIICGGVKPADGFVV